MGVFAYWIHLLRMSKKIKSSMEEPVYSTWRRDSLCFGSRAYQSFLRPFQVELSFFYSEYFLDAEIMEIIQKTLSIICLKKLASNAGLQNTISGHSLSVFQSYY